MAKIPMVKCQNCGNEFSALRADCPKCGQRRTVGDTYAARPKPARREKAQSDTGNKNSNWQRFLGLALIGVSILAVVLLVVSGKGGGNGFLFRPTPTPTPEQTMVPRPTPTPTPTPKVENVKIFYLTKEITAEAGGFTMYVGDDPLTISARAYPNDKFYNARFTWSLSDNSKARLKPSEDTQSCEVTVLESAGGYITLTVRCFGAEQSVPLYIWSREVPDEPETTP